MGHEFFYETGEDHFPRLMAARAMTALFSVALGALVFCWSRRLFGTPGAFVSLALLRLQPDLPRARRLRDLRRLHRPLHAGLDRRLVAPPGDARRRRLPLSAVVVRPRLRRQVLGRLPPADDGPLRRSSTSPPAAGAPARSSSRPLGHAAVAVAVIWAFYGFRYSAFNPALPARPTSSSSPGRVMYAHTGRIGAADPLPRRASTRSPRRSSTAPPTSSDDLAVARRLPERRVQHHRLARRFFIWAFALKTTLPFLAAPRPGPSGLAVRGRIQAGGRGRPPGGPPPADAAPRPLRRLLAPSRSQSHLNIGHRHLLPIYPVALHPRRRPRRVARAPARLGGRRRRGAPRLARRRVPRRSPRTTSRTSTSWPAARPAAASTWSTARSTGARTCPASRRGWTRNRRPGEDAYLAYFGNGEPRYYKLPVKRLAYINGFHEDEPYIPLGPGPLLHRGDDAAAGLQPRRRDPGPRRSRRNTSSCARSSPCSRPTPTDPAARAQADAEMSRPRNGPRAATASCTCASPASAITCGSRKPDADDRLLDLHLPAERARRSGPRPRGRCATGARSSTAAATAPRPLIGLAAQASGSGRSRRSGSAGRAGRRSASRRSSRRW